MIERAIGRPLALYEALRARDDAWRDVARAYDFGVLREPGAYVAYLGDDMLRVAPYADLDPDDCLAQIVLHELCHFAVEGPASRSEWDWGLNNTDDADAGSELVALRAQAVILDAYGLRQVLAPTTDFRVDYDAFGDGDPLAGAELPEGAAARASAGVERLRSHAGWPALHDALEAVRVLAAEYGHTHG